VTFAHRVHQPRSTPRSTVSDFGVPARFTLPPIEGGHCEAVANFGKYLGKRRSPCRRIEKKAHVSAVSEIFADAMVAKSELLEHYEEKERPPSEYGFFHRCPVPTYLLATEVLCFYDDRKLGEIRDEILWVSAVP
jgi:hypothetical protein